MEIAVLTARLEAQIAQFETGMASAIKVLNSVQKQIKETEKVVVALREEMKTVKMSQKQATETSAVLDQMERKMASAAAGFKEAKDAIRNVQMDPSQAVVTGAVADAEVRDLKKVRDAAIEADLALHRVQTRTPGGQFAGMAIPMGRVGNQGTAAIQGMEDYRRYLDQLARSRGVMLGPQTLEDYLREAATPTHGVRMAGRFGFDAIPNRERIRIQPPAGLGVGNNIRGAERYLRSLGFNIAGGGVGTRPGRGTGTGGFFGGRGGFLEGVLPGGRRAGPAAVLTGIGLLAGAGPAAVPAAAGAGVGIAAGFTALLGAAATLKLAFADMTAASFKTKAGFDALTPAQQSLVITLKSLDAGVMKPLEKLAQTNLIPRLTDALHKLVSGPLVGAITKSVGSFATNIGKGAQGAAGILGSSDFAKSFGAVMQADSRYVRDFIVDIGHLTSAFFSVLQAAIPLTNWFNKLTSQFSLWADTAARSGQQSGALGQFFERAKLGLQAISKLLSSIVAIAGDFGRAFGFKNSIALIGLFSTAFQGIANFIKRNKMVLHDFFAGAIGAIRNLEAILAPISAFLSKILGLINQLIGGTNGWRKAIEILAGVLTVKWLQSVLVKLGSIGVAETVLANGATAASIKVGGLRGALLALGGADVLAALSGLLVPLAGIAAVFATPNSTGGNPTVPYRPDFRLTKDVMQSQTGKAMPPALKKEFLAYRAGTVNQTDFETWLATHLGLLSQYGIQVTPALREYAHTVSTSGGADSRLPSGPGFGGITGAVGKITSAGVQAALKLPASISNQIVKASAGHGSMEKANAQAYAYYNQLLAQPGLSKAEKTAIYYAQAPYTPPAAFQQSGGGSVGFHGPTTAGGAVFQAQQALAGAMGAGSGVSFNQQVKLAKQYEAAAAAAYKHLKGQKVVAADVAAKQAELTTLARDEANAHKDINLILHRQSVEEAKLAKAREKAREKALDDARKIQISQHGTRIQALRTNLAGGMISAFSPSDQLKAVNTALLGAGKQLEQLKTLQDKLLSHEKQTDKLKKEENQIQHEINQTKGLIQTAQKDQLKALKAKQQDDLQSQISKILGLGEHESKGHVAAARSSSQVRSFLNNTLKKFGLGGTGSKPLEPFVKELYKAGDINKRQYTSLEKILAAIGLMKQDTGTISSGITGNISQRLKQIKDELAPSNNFSKLNFVTSEQAILKHAGIHISGTKAQRAKFMEQANEALGLHGKLHRGSGSVNGVPLNPDGTPAIKVSRLRLPHHISGTYNPHLPLPHHMGGTYKIHVKVEADGSTPMSRAAAKAIADEVYKVFQGNRRRNTTQMTGANAGRNLGSGLG